MFGTMVNHWELLGLSVDAAIVYLFYRLAKGSSKEADLIKDLAVYEVGPDLREQLINEGQSVPYVCIQGITRAVSRALRSQFHDNEEGVVKAHRFVEHKSKRSNGFWTDEKRVIKDDVRYSPFLIGTPAPSKYDVSVQQPENAHYLQESLVTTYDNYEPTKDSAVSRGIDRLFGEVVKGHQETEKMLHLGVQILGVGKLSIEGGKIVLSPPDDGIGRYILTTLSKDKLVGEISFKASIFKIFAWVFGVLGVGMLSYIIYRNVRHYWQDFQFQRMLRQMRSMRAQQQQEQLDLGNNNGDENENRDACVVCLTNPRELVVLECGHLCLCGDCARALPQPRQCPMCRGAIARLLPVYNA